MKEKTFVLSVRAVILDDQKRCLLLQRHRNSTHHPKLWEFPGGKMDPGENFADALVREVKEETGLTVKLINALGTAQWEMKERIVVYIIMAARVVGGEIVESDESEGHQWVKFDGLDTVKLCPQFAAFGVALKNLF